MTFDAWVKANLGRGIDYDGVYGIQCVDLVKHYVKNVLGITPQSIGNAIEYYNKRNTLAYLKDNFLWINNTADFVPQKGDICVFKNISGKGHISIATGEGDTHNFYSYDQNYPRGVHEPMTKIYHSYTSFLGVLRPRANIKTVAYYPRYMGKSNSLVDGLKAVGVSSSFASRKAIARANGISAYVGSSAQNTRLLTLLKAGRLVRC